jgi:hypothetical protein
MADDRFTEAVTFKLTKAQSKKLEELAEAVGLGKNIYARVVTVQAITNEIPRLRDEMEAIKILIETSQAQAKVSGYEPEFALTLLICLIGQNFQEEGKDLSKEKILEYVNDAFLEARRIAKQ